MARELPFAARMRSLVVWIGSPWLFTLCFWACFGACIDAPIAPSPPTARIVAAWDPLACGDPHRVVVELADDEGAQLGASVPCALGGLVLDAPHFGSYRGRVYAWLVGAAIRSESPAELEIADPIVHWELVTPSW